MNELEVIKTNSAAALPVEELLFDIDSPEVEEGFVVDSLDKATWCAGRYIAAGRRIDERKKLADFYKRKIDIWLAESSKADVSTQSAMASLIEPFARDYISELRNRKSFQLLGATVGIRKLPDRLDVSDEDSAVRFCEENFPDIVQTKRTISRNLAKAYLKDGHAIPGLGLSAGAEELVIKEV